MARLAWKRPQKVGHNIIYKKETTVFFVHIKRRKALDNIVMTGTMTSRRSRGRLREMALDG